MVAACGVMQLAGESCVERSAEGVAGSASVALGDDDAKGDGTNEVAAVGSGCLTGEELQPADSASAAAAAIAAAQWMPTLPFTGVSLPIIRVVTTPRWVRRDMLVGVFSGAVLIKNPNDEVKTLIGTCSTMAQTGFGAMVGLLGGRVTNGPGE